MKATLKSLKGGDTDIPLDCFPVLIGRGSDVTLQIDDRWASRRHCMLEVVEGRLVVRDLGSKHGTFVNNQPVQQAVLDSGDVLTVGMSSFEAICDPS